MSRAFVYHRRVQFHETDAAGIMHFARWFNLMEECEHAFWREIGLTVHMTAGDDHRPISWPRVAVNCEYMGPARFEEQLQIVLVPSKLGNKSITFDFTFRRNDDVLANGRIKAVSCAMGDGAMKSVPIPTHIRSRIDAWLAGNDRQETR